MSENLKLWTALATPPKTALKEIKGGRLRGKTDINPQWRYQAMTEAFGMCGVGWKYTIDRLWTEEGDAKEVFAFASVSLYIKHGDTWSDAIPGIGGNFLMERESGGIHNNDEAFKMSVTDALGTAMKMLGVAAEVYLGNFDGSKYSKDQPEGGKPAPSREAFGGRGQAEKPFKWSDATKTEKKQYTLKKIAECVVHPNKKEAMDKLREIMGKLKMEDLDDKGREEVADAITQAERTLTESEFGG